MTRRIISHLAILILSAALTACGGGGGGGSSNTGGPVAGSPGAGGSTGGTPEPTTPPEPTAESTYGDYGIGSDPAPGTPEPDAAVKESVTPAYVGAGLMLGILDAARAAAGYPQFVLDTTAANGKATPGSCDSTGCTPSGYTVACPQGGQLHVKSWLDMNNDGSAIGEAVVLNPLGCLIDAGAPGLAFADEFGGQLYIDASSATSARVNWTSGTLGDYAAPLAVTADLEIETAGDVVTIAGPVSGGGYPLFISPGVYGRNSVTAAPGFTITLTHDSTTLVDSIEISGLTTHIRAPSSASIEQYEIATTSPLQLTEVADSISLQAGAFTITDTGSGTVYTYTVDGDPSYLLVTADADADGTPEASGRVPQALVMQRITFN